MRRAGWVLAAAAVLAATGLVFLAPTGGAGSSALGRGAEGWLVARLYLAARGAEPHLLDRPFSPAEVSPVLVVTLPWSRGALTADPEPLRQWVEAGGILLLAYTGRSDRLEERRLLETFGIETQQARRAPPWGPFAWRRWADEEWTLAPTPAVAAAARPLVVRARERLPSPPAAALVLYRRPETGAAAIWSLPVGEGRLVVMPADALANARLAAPGNADLLETLLAWYPERWSFDEYHHGLVHPDVAATTAPPLAFDLFVLHLGLLYLLAVAALSRRFGPAWREPPARSGSAGAFLVGLGRLHDRLGHHAAVAERLVARARELEPHLAFGAELAPRAARVAGGRELVAIAREVAGIRAASRFQTGRSRARSNR
jgi:hypothetical protein